MSHLQIDIERVLEATFFRVCIVFGVVAVDITIVCFFSDASHSWSSWDTVMRIPVEIFYALISRSIYLCYCNCYFCCCCCRFVFCSHKMYYHHQRQHLLNRQNISFTFILWITATIHKLYLLSHSHSQFFSLHSEICVFVSRSMCVCLCTTK